MARFCAEIAYKALFFYKRRKTGQKTKKKRPEEHILSDLLLFKNAFFRL